MGVYVKEMKMPPTCGFCKLAWCCKASEGEAVDLRMRNSSRHPNCPLIEVKTPHGRLIDVTKIPYLETADPEVAELVGETLTVIEAEVE